MQVQHYEFILIKEIDKLIEESGETVSKSEIIHLRNKLLELITQNDRFAMLYHLSAQEVLGDKE